MPRRRKKKKSQNERRAGQGRRDRDNLIARTWSQLIRAGEAKRKQYDATADDVLNYFKANHQALYDDDSVQQHWQGMDGATAISVPKVAQMRNSLGPRLYQAKSIRSIHPTTSDRVLMGLARVLETYLNYTARETKFPRQLRKSIDDGILRGRCLMNLEWDDVRGLITSRYISSKNFVFDPDYDDIEDARWIAFRYREPKWETERRIKEKWRIKNLSGGRNPLDDTHAPQEGREGREAKTAEVVEYWVVLSKMGRGFRAAPAEGNRFSDKEDFVRLEIVLDHDVPLAEGDWDVPLYMDRDWPVSHADFVDTLDEAWPESVMGQVISLQKGVDLLTSLRMTSAKNRDRVVVFCDAKLEDEVQGVLQSGSAADFLPIDVPDNKRLQDVVAVADFGQGSAESGIERQFLLDQIESTTGVTPILTGADVTSAKDRSATASNIRQAATQARVADFEDTAQSLLTDVARKEAIAVKLLLEDHEVSPFVKAEDIGLMYIRIDLPAAVVPVRDIRSQEEREADPTGGVITLEQIYPQASNYFDSVEEAFQVAMEMWESMQSDTDPRVLEIAESLALAGIDENGLPLKIIIDVVDVERVWLDTAGITTEELMRELSYEIQAGSGLRINKDAERENADNLTQTVLPAFAGAGDIAASNKVLEIRDNAFEVPEDQRVRFSEQLPQPQQAPNA